MDTIAGIEGRRERILEEMRAIRSMRRGSVNEQYFKKKLKAKPQMVTQGPYYVFSRSEGGRTKSYRLRKGPELEQARKDVEAHKKYSALCREFEELAERLGQLEHQLEEASPKKNGRDSD